MRQVTPFHFVPAGDYEGYPAASPDLLIDPVGDQYTIPARPLDVFQFVTEKTAEPTSSLGIALVQGVDIIKLSVGTVLVTDSHYWWTVTIPNDVPFGCYRLMIYGSTDLSSEWTETGYTCELDENGQPTGYAEITEERNENLQTAALWESQSLMIYQAPNTVYVEYTDENDLAFSIQYSENPGFLNACRLHLALSEPSFIVDESLYRDSSGKIRKGNTIIGKKYKLLTDYFDEWVHDALTIAAKHEYFYIDGRLMSLDGVMAPEFVEAAVSNRRHPDKWIASGDVTDENFYFKNNDCGQDDDIKPACPRQYVFTVTQSVGADQTAINSFDLVTNRFVNMFVTVSPFTQLTEFASDGTLPEGLYMSVEGEGIRIIGTPEVVGSSTLILKAKNSINTCGQITLLFNTNENLEITTIDYTSEDFNTTEYE